jgi:hypothetical protein
LRNSDDWTLLVAIYAALVSTGLLILRIWDHKLSGGWVKVSTSFHPGIGEIPGSVLVARCLEKQPEDRPPSF